MYRPGWTRARDKAHTDVVHRSRAARIRRRVHAVRPEAARVVVGRKLLDAPPRPALHGARAAHEGRAREREAGARWAPPKALRDHSEGPRGARRVARRGHGLAR